MNFTDSMTFTPSKVRSLWLVAVAVPLIGVASAAALAGGMKYAMVALAILMAGWVYKNPKEGMAAGTVYLIACNVIFPNSARFDWTIDPWEMRYWASGLLIVTLPAVARIGLKSFLRIPTSAKAFLLVAVTAAITGFHEGASLSYASRQLYGSLLLVAYFAIAYRVADEELFLRRIRSFGLVGAVGFFVYFAAIFAEYGFHKELTTLGTQEGAVAILCMGVGLARKSPAWIVSGAIAFAVPALLFWRHVVLMCVFAFFLALAMIATTKKAKFVLYSASALLLIPSMFPSGAELILERALNSTPLEKILPAGASDASSLEDRVLQLSAAADVLQRSPLLGSGFGNEISWDSPVRGAMAQAFVDNGWAYVAVKMGVLGIIAFSWFLFTVLRCVSRSSLAISVALLALVFVAQFSEPDFFQFSTSPLCGALAGLVMARKHAEGSGAALLAQPQEGFGSA